MICTSCRTKYDPYMLYNYNLDLCPTCFKDDEVVYDFCCDEVSHNITCPKCKKTYDFIVDKKCKTRGCDVWFFWDELDSRIFAKWKE